MNRTIFLILICFLQQGFSQENKHWIKGNIFTTTDTIQGYVKKNSISFDSVKFRRNIDDPTEHLTPDLIEGYKTKDYIYQKKFIKKLGGFGYYKFCKLIDKGKFTLYETTEQQNSFQQNSILILESKEQTITLKFYAFEKLKNKKKIAKKLDGYNGLQNIVLKRRFDYSSFKEKIKNLNSK